LVLGRKGQSGHPDPQHPLVLYTIFIFAKIF